MLITSATVLRTGLAETLETTRDITIDGDEVLLQADLFAEIGAQLLEARVGGVSKDAEHIAEAEYRERLTHVIAIMPAIPSAASHGRVKVV